MQDVALQPLPPSDEEVVKEEEGGRLQRRSVALEGAPDYKVEGRTINPKNQPGLMGARSGRCLRKVVPNHGEPSGSKMDWAQTAACC